MLKASNKIGKAELGLVTKSGVRAPQSIRGKVPWRSAHASFNLAGEWVEFCRGHGDIGEAHCWGVAQPRSGPGLWTPRPLLLPLGRGRCCAVLGSGTRQSQPEPRCELDGTGWKWFWWCMYTTSSAFSDPSVPSALPPPCHTKHLLPSCCLLDGQSPCYVTSASSHLGEGSAQ